MAITLRDFAASVSEYERHKIKYRVVARPVAQIIDEKGNVIAESANEWEIRQIYRLIKGRSTDV